MNNYRGKSINTINQQLDPDFYTWTDKNFTLDASATIDIANGLKLFVEANNLTDEPLKNYMGDRRLLTTVDRYGIRGQGGLRWVIFR